ncbi:MAG: DOPA 4,5-dioxygenase family protein [Asticcacaulis sp.]
MSKKNKSTAEVIDGNWADLVSPERRKLLVGSGLAAAGLVAASATQTHAQTEAATPAAAPAGDTPRPRVKREAGKSPWGYETYKEPTTKPLSVRPGEEEIPLTPRPYTDIKSYHAHVYFDDDTYEKAALLRKWVAERFVVELGHWNIRPLGPHVTPSFYFGFANEQLTTIAPWLQLNSLGLTILIHPNTDDPRADHLYYALWVNRDQPVNGYGMKSKVSEEEIEKILPNTAPTVKLEV